MKNAAEISARLADRCEDVASHLLQRGRRRGREWVAGSVAGEEGDSLKVHLGGSKAGVWKDFATDEGGDLLDLWAAVRNQTISQAIVDAMSYLGIREHRVENQKRVYAKPSRDGVSSLPPQIAEWLLTVRKIGPETAKRFKLASRKGALMFPYLRDGELVAAKYRKIPAKEFFVDADCEPCLFGWQALTGLERAVVLCEGEMDALALAEYGVSALSVPFGGGKGGKQSQWIDAEYDRLAQFDTLFLALDNDTAGQEATIEIMTRLGRERCRLVTLPRKDANACLMDGVSREAILSALAESKTLDPKQLRQASEFEDELVSEFSIKPGSERGVRLPWMKASDSVVLRYGEVSLWLGVNGHGKSQGMGQITLGALAQDYRACVASMEFKSVKWLKRMVRQATATDQPTPAYVRHVAHWFHDKLWVFDVVNQARTETILEVFAYAARRYGVKFFVIDNLQKCGFADDDYAGQKAFVDALTSFARDYEVHVALVHHMRKSDSEDRPGGKMDAKGSGGITDMVDTIAVWWRNKPKEQVIHACEMKHTRPDQETIDKPDGVLTFHKQRNGEEEPSLALWFDQRTCQFLGNRTDRPHRFIGFEAVEGREADL